MEIFIYFLLLCVTFQRAQQITVNADETSNSTIIDSTNVTSISTDNINPTAIISTNANTEKTPATEENTTDDISTETDSTNDLTAIISTDASTDQTSATEKNTTDELSTETDSTTKHTTDELSISENVTDDSSTITPTRNVPLPNLRNLYEFNGMINCLQPELSTADVLTTYADYGCYCGKGGSGTALDETDNCCRIHDSCYGDSKQLAGFLDLTYTTLYNYTCEKQKQKVSCDEKNNNDFQQFVCECDRVASECFKAKRPTFNNEKFGNVDTKACCSSTPPSKSCTVWDGKGFQASPEATAKPPKVVAKKSKNSRAPNISGNLRLVMITLLVIAALM